MKSFKIQKILIPIDFSETSLLAIEHGAFMAKLFKAELILLHVLEKHWESFNIVVPEVVIENLSEFTDKIEAKLNELAENIRKEYGVLSTIISATGNIFNEIIEASKDSKADLVIMGTHGVSGFEEFFVGSNTYKVVTKSVCPVISVQTHAKKIGFKDILLPIDNSLHSRQKVNYAIGLAKQYGSKIHIVGLLDTDDIIVAKKMDIILDQVQKYIEENELSFSREILNGKNQSVTTLKYADKVNADLIVIMTDQEEDLSGFFIGPYAQQVVNHSKIPVMSIKPHEGIYTSFQG